MGNLGPNGMFDRLEGIAFQVKHIIDIREKTDTGVEQFAAV